MTATALDVLRALYAYTREHRLPPPAALVGDWWDADAVIAPSINLREGCLPDDRNDRFWLGYYGFGGTRHLESALPRNVGGLTGHVLVLRDTTWEVVSADGSMPPDWVTATLDDVATHRPVPAPWWARWSAPDRDHHITAINHCLEAIRAGEVYQACVCTAFTGDLHGSPVDFYCDLAAASRPAKSAFLQGDWGTVASFSPETFLTRAGTVVTSSPIKGTLPATADPTGLTASVKDVAENVMIVDLVRNDLGRVARTGSVRVTALLEVVAAPGVWHLVSTVSATVPSDIGSRELLEATWPPASVTGTPKIRARELLEGWESTARGVYCGAIGLAGPGSLLDLNVAIRTVELTPQGSMTLGVGGGITIDSSPDNEWQECLHKAASIVSAAAPAATPASQ